MPNTLTVDLISAPMSTEIALSAENNAALKVAFQRGASVLYSTVHGQSSGFPMCGILGETLVYGDFIFCNRLDSRFLKCDPATKQAMPVIGVITTGGDENDPGIILTYGVLTNDNWNWNMSDPDKLVVYAGYNGTGTQEPISISGHYGQALGVPLSAKTLLFNPSYVLVASK